MDPDVVGGGGMFSISNAELVHRNLSMSFDDEGGATPSTDYNLTAPMALITMPAGEASCNVSFDPWGDARQDFQVFVQVQGSDFDATATSFIASAAPGGACTIFANAAATANVALQVLFIGIPIDSPGH